MTIQDWRNSKLCPMLWKGLHVGTRGEVRPCCFWSDAGNLKDSSLQVIWNSDKMKEARKVMLEGKEYPDCVTCCYNQERRGQGSTRLGYIDQVGQRKLNQIDLSLETKVDPWIVDLRLSNICNLKCKTCWAGASSLWQQAEKLTEEELGINSIATRKRLKNLIIQNAEHLTEIYFAGGEPTIMEEDWEILEYLIERKCTNVYLRYNTNLKTLTYKGKNIVDLWKIWLEIGGRLQLGISIDGMGPIVEFNRVGTIWHKLDANVREIVAKIGKYHPRRLLLEFTPVLSTYTVLSIPDQIRYAEQVGIGKQYTLYHNILQSPEVLNLRNLTPEAKEIIVSELEKRRDRYRDLGECYDRYCTVVKNYLQQDPIHEPACREEYENFYPARFNELVPELADWWKNIPQFKES